MLFQKNCQRFATNYRYIDKSKTNLSFPKFNLSNLSKLTQIFENYSLSVQYMKTHFSGINARNQRQYWIDVTYFSQKDINFSVLENTFRQHQIDVILAKPIQASQFFRDLSEINLIGIAADQKSTAYQLKEKQFLRHQEQTNQHSKNSQLFQSFPSKVFTKDQTQTWIQRYRAIKNIASKSFKNEEISIIRQSQYQYTQKIPQILDIQNKLKIKSKFKLKQVFRDLSKRQFLNFLATGTLCFFSHFEKNINNFIVPDYFTTVFGYIPLMLDQKITDLIQKIGVLSLGASDYEVQKIFKFYEYQISYRITLDGLKRKLEGPLLVSSEQNLLSFINISNSIKKYDLTDIYEQKADKKYLISKDFQESLKELSNLENTVMKGFESKIDKNGNVYCNRQIATVNLLI